MTKIELCTESHVWDEILHDLSGHPLQLWGWGEVKGRHNWKPHRLIVTDDDEQVIGAAQVLTRRLPAPFNRMSYVPRGPAVQIDTNPQEVLDALRGYVKKHLPGTVLTIEPHWRTVPDTLKGWKHSSNTILIGRTLILDLTQSVEQLLAHMTNKTRQYIRKSEREGVTVRRLKQRDEIAECLAIYHQTAQRAGFALHDDQYYYDIHDKLGESSLVFGAFHGEKLVAFVWLAISSRVAFELYGGMNDEGQRLRANYALKWYAITRCQEWGIAEYDMNGLLNDGVSTFKKGFADHETMLVGTYDAPLSALYPVWTKVLPTGKRLARRVRSLLK